MNKILSTGLKPLPIGISDYKEIITSDCYYIDKTLLIQELLSTKNKVTLICRPRRFGKTLSLSMLKYFFEKTSTSHAHLFEDKKIWSYEEAQKVQGKYPVIFITFKDIKEGTFDKAYNAITILIANEFERHKKDLLPTLDEDQAAKYKSIVTRSADSEIYKESLLFLSQLLHAHYGEPVMVLLDEYDTPIHAAYMRGYYQEMVDIIKTLFGKVLKDNSYLERAVLTGILRTAKEGIFSDLNNVSVCTFMNNRYADKVGFTEDEVQELRRYYATPTSMVAIKQWYNGYRAGESTLVYNPWSLLECASESGLLKPYWVNTSGNDLIKKIIAQATSDVKADLERIMMGDPVIKIIEEAFTFASIDDTEDAVWSLLLFSGYLTHNNRELTSDGKYECSLVVPNHEIKALYKDLITQIFTKSFSGSRRVVEFCKALIAGDVDLVQELLQEFILTNMSFHDIATKEPENSYHLFVLGLLVTLEGKYRVTSNNESGFGRYDVMLTPVDTSQPGIIIEFKKARNQTLEAATDDALAQIEDKQYAHKLRDASITTILAYGIAFESKKVLVRSKAL